MLKFKVKSVTNHDKFTYVVVEPLKEPPFLEEVIPSGCIQYIFQELLENKDSKDACCRLCDILCNVFMEDSTSRKTK